MVISWLMLGPGGSTKLLAQVQQRTLQGYITALGSGDSIAGATITVRETAKKYVAGGGGFFKITAPAGESPIHLLVEAVGYQPDSLRVNASVEMIQIQLTPSTQQLDEVIVVGYSDKKQSELTSAVTVVSAKDLQDVTTNDVGSMLQGKVAGLQVVNSSGAPGANAEIRLRGISSVNASQTPLYVVDGIIGGNFDPNDVESMTVLKDAAATAMYGSQANAGVIVVTTRQAKTARPSIRANITTGYRTADFGSMDMMNGAELYDYQKEFYRDYVPTDTGNSYKIDLLKFYAERPISLRSTNYNWLDAIFDPALMQNYHVSVSGRTGINDYYIGLSYYNEKGTFKNTGFQRGNLRASSTLNFNPHISLTNSINVSGAMGKSYDYNDIYYAYLNLPWDNPLDSLGSPVYVDGNAAFKWWSRDKVNPLHTIANSEHPYKSFDVNYDIKFKADITHWLNFTSTNRASASYSKNSTYYNSAVAGQYHGTGYLEEQNILDYGYVSNSLLNFNFKLDGQGNHALTGLVGIALEGGHTEYGGAAGRGLPFGLKVLNVVSSNLSVNGYNERSNIVSYLSQVSYNYKEKYFLTGSYRVDGSTAFQKDRRYGSFPAVSAAWVASKEDFLKSSDWIDFLRLRASYGITGTQDIGASRYLGLYSLASQYNGSSAATPLQLASPSLTWESKHQLNLGLDLNLIRSIELTVDAYKNNTKNLLLMVSQPLSVGFETRWENAGEIENKGLEIGLTTHNINHKDFGWTTQFNISFNSNKLKSLPATFVKTGSWAISQIYRNGGNLYEFYMPVYKGVDPATGAPLWEQLVTDEAGNVTERKNTSNYSEASLQEVGSALPKLQGGMTQSLRFKQFSFSVNAYFLSGNKVYSNNLRFLMNDGNEPYYNQIVLPDDYHIWTHPGDVATNPSPQNAANANEPSTRYLMDGSFIAIRNLTLGYNLPESLAKKLGMREIQVSVSADNVYTFTGFIGQDPQTTIQPSDFATPGVSDFKYPNNRQYLLHINMAF